MEFKQELLGAAYRQTARIQKALEELEVYPDFTKEEITTLARILAQRKVDLLGGKRSDYISGQEWYVNDLVSKANLDGNELFQICYEELLIDNSSFDELTAKLNGKRVRPAKK